MTHGMPRFNGEAGNLMESSLASEQQEEQKKQDGGK
jgi:hypothetical protein